MNGTAIILSDENISLRKKIKILQEEIESLKTENQNLLSKLHEIKKICENDNDVKNIVNKQNERKTESK